MSFWKRKSSFLGQNTFLWLNFKCSLILFLVDSTCDQVREFTQDITKATFCVDSFQILSQVRQQLNCSLEKTRRHFQQPNLWFTIQTSLQEGAHQCGWQCVATGQVIAWKWAGSIPSSDSLLVHFVLSCPSSPLCFSKSYTSLETQLTSSMEPLLTIPITMAYPFVNSCNTYVVAVIWSLVCMYTVLYVFSFLNKILSSLRCRVMSPISKSLTLPPQCRQQALDE